MNERFPFRGGVLEERHRDGVGAGLHRQVDVETFRERFPARLVAPIELEAADDDRVDLNLCRDLVQLLGDGLCSSRRFFACGKERDDADPR